MDFRDIKEFVKDIFSYIIVIGVIVLIRFLIIAPVEVIGNSMNPSLKNNEILFADQLIYKYKQLKRFDYVVIKEEGSPHLIKRIIGLPGEKIKYVNDELYVNDKKVKEKFSKLGFTEDFKLEDINYDFIPKDMYFVVGDNRNNSTDSRKLGLITKENIIGRPFLRVWPLKSIKIIK